MEEKKVSLQSVVMEMVGKFDVQRCVTGMGKYKWARFCLLSSSTLEIKVEVTLKPEGDAFTFWTDAFH